MNAESTNHIILWADKEYEKIMSQFSPLSPTMLQATVQVEGRAYKIQGKRGHNVHDNVDESGVI